MATTRMKALVAVLTLLGLGSCAGAAILSQDYVEPTYEASRLNGIAREGGLLLQLKGAAFADEAASERKVIATALEKAHPGPRFSVYHEPPNGRTLTYRVVMIFNPAPLASANEACANPNQPTLPPEAGSHDLYVMAVFCEFNSRLTSIVAQGTVAGPEDPAFLTFMKQVTLALFPQRRNEIQHQDRCDVDPDC